MGWLGRNPENKVSETIYVLGRKLTRKKNASVDWSSITQPPRMALGIVNDEWFLAASLAEKTGFGKEQGIFRDIVVGITRAGQHPQSC